MEYESPTHICRVDDDGLITVDTKTCPTIRRSTITREGTTVELIPAAKLFRTDVSLRNAFVVTYRGAALWNVDCNAGMQRWHGTQTGRAVARAFRVLGFDPTATQRVMAKARQYIHECTVHQF